MRIKEKYEVSKWSARENQYTNSFKTYKPNDESGDVNEDVVENN